MDKYTNFEALKKVEKEGVSFHVYIREQENANTAVIAPHGGGIEPGTSEICRRIAGTDLSLALFEGIKNKQNSELHITSINFDEPRCLALVQSSHNTIAIHGEKSLDKVVYIGGRDIKLGKLIQSELELAGFQVKNQSKPHLQGKASKNICNRGSSQRGVQLEIARGLRETFFKSLTSVGREKPTKKLDVFVNAVRKGLHNAGKL